MTPRPSSTEGFHPYGAVGETVIVVVATRIDVEGGLGHVADVRKAVAEDDQIVERTGGRDADAKK